MSDGPRSEPQEAAPNEQTVWADRQQGLPRGSVLLEREGFRSVGSRGRPGRLVRYGEITHLSVGTRGLWIGLTSGIRQLRRGRFRESDGPERLERSLATRIARQPGGLMQLARFAEIEALARRNPRRIATGSMALLCVVVFGLQLADPFVAEIGTFSPSLVAEGQLWRILTSNFLHGAAFLPLHLVLNLVVILAAALLVERPLGSARTVVVMGAAALGSALASGLAGYREVLGASGVAMGLVGAALCLELHFARHLPAWWRLPRGLFIAAIVLELSKDWFVPLIAAAAHLGGFLAGYVVTALVARSAFLRRESPFGLRALAGTIAVAVAVSFVATVPALSRDPGALERLGRDLLNIEEPWPGRLNDLAWRMATESEPSPEQLEVARALAERAVDQTSRANPDLLDTLAEILFQLGDARGAVDVIDEAIALAGGEPYFREQRRRFTGERAAEDRPAPPELPWPFSRPAHPRFDEAPGIPI